MNIHLKVIDEFNELTKDFGPLEVPDIVKIIEYATNNNLFNFSCIELFNDTYFNIDQLEELKPELDSLISSLPQHENTLLIIKEGLALTMKEGIFSYLKFEIQ